MFWQFFVTLCTCWNPQVVLPSKILLRVLDFIYKSKIVSDIDFQTLTFQFFFNALFKCLHVDALLPTDRLDSPPKDKYSVLSTSPASKIDNAALISKFIVPATFDLFSLVRVYLSNQETII